MAAWGLWNEPNLPSYWQGSRREYIYQILIPGALAVRAADPSALVAGPDLAHLSSGSWDTWLREVLRDGQLWLNDTRPTPMGRN